MLEFVDITEPRRKELSNEQLLSGKNIPDIKLFELVSEDDFEIITEQWAFSQKDKYNFVKRTGGSGDKGRDIFCYIDEAKTKLDIYQCKHYKGKLTPSNIYVEIGKLMYYTFKKEFAAPKSYYIVSSKGCGAALSILMEPPYKLRDNLIGNWNKCCKEGITKEEKIELSPELKKYIIDFDFSIIKEITPTKFLSEFEKTKYYSEWFGLKKFKRKAPPKPTEKIQDSELTYVNKLYKAYGSVNNKIIEERSQLTSQHSVHLDIQRKCFYSAEGLKQFSRDSLPSNETFQDLQEQIIDPVKSQIISNSHKNGLECFDSANRLAQTLNIGDNSLTEFLKTGDRTGILHQVANEDASLNWTNENE